MKAQVRVVSVLCVLHNILVNLQEIEDLDITVDDEEDDTGEGLTQDQQNGQRYHIARSQTIRAGAKRYRIAL